jgi:hypothetical protein
MTMQEKEKNHIFMNFNGTLPTLYNKKGKLKSNT